MSITTTATPPSPTFTHSAYGVSITWFGEDGGMASPGHVPDLRFVAACNNLARKDACLLNLWDDSTATLDETLSMVRRVWAVPAASTEYGYGSWAVTWRDVTEQTPGAIPLTLLWP